MIKVNVNARRRVRYHRWHWRLRSAVTVIWETINFIRCNKLQTYAAAVAYHTLFSLVPLVIVLTALSSRISQAIGVDDVMASVTDWLFARLPYNAAVAILDPLRNVLEHQPTGVLTFGILLTIVTARNGTIAMIDALNVAFGVRETRPWLRKQLIALGLTLSLGLAVSLSSLVFFLATTIGTDAFGLVGQGNRWATVWNYGQWPLIGLLVMLGVAAFYTAGPNVDAKFHWLTPASLLVVVFWAGVTFGLSWYLGRFGAYATAYGPLGGVLAFIFWVYLMSLVMLVGGVLTAVLARRHGLIRGPVWSLPGCRPDETAIHPDA